jgi:cell wall-associated NlpC family hydrolase
MIAPASASAYWFGSRTLSMGMRGNDVRTLQTDLWLVTHLYTRASGYFNFWTKVHVKDFQRSAHLGVDGVVGPQTAQALASAATQARAAKAHRSATPSHATATHAGATTGTTKQTLPPADSGGAAFVPPPSDAPVTNATLNSSGLAVAPSTAPLVIRNVIAAANKIAFKPYIYGGGHASFTAAGYDCSGSVSYALHGGNLLASPLDSTQFESYGQPGPGRWITIWANAGHAYMQIAGLFYDTAGQSSRNNDDRWTTKRISPSTGFVEVHPTGW